MNKEERLKAAETVTVKVEWKDHNKIVLTNKNGDTYTSRSEELMDFLHSAGAEAEAQSKWVSVDDRLPEFGEWILAYDEELGRHISWFDYEGFVQRNRNKLMNVTHWQPLPSPPLN